MDAYALRHPLVVQRTNSPKRDLADSGPASNPAWPPGLSWSNLKRPPAFRKCLVSALDSLHTVPVELFRSCLQFTLGFLKMVDGCLDPRMVKLGRRTCCRDWSGGGSGSGGLRGPWLRVKNQW